MDRYDLGHNRMPIGLRFAFFKFHLRNVYLTWYYNRRNSRHARMSKRHGRKIYRQVGRRHKGIETAI
jgi:hypothetical protein